MKSVSTQTPDSGCAASGMEHLRTQLQLLLSDLRKVGELTGSRGVRLHSLERTVHSSDKALDSMGAAIEGLEQEIEASQEDLSDLDDMYSSLLSKQDEIREEKEKKEEELGLAKRRLDDQNMDFYKQFEGLKTDVKRHRHDARPLILELDTCDKATLSRLKYFTRSDFISSDDMEKTQKLIKYMEYASRHRQMFDEVGDLEFDMRNS
ncbi:uncharacterized protein LOC124260762 isoform X4 [Haliotis rubra]|uniref:uncharacterized protein LOC124260762 isoform X4 n=1 Tax=Haliotis rubra TaxID=36100 RepID=UPI001EE56FD4|nr:uncharacterized protein LOC124260762 isoform X4 [Haliotis rubra]